MSKCSVCQRPIKKPGRLTHVSCGLRRNGSRSTYVEHEDREAYSLAVEILYGDTDWEDPRVAEVGTPAVFAAASAYLPSQEVKKLHEDFDHHFPRSRKR